MTITTDEARFTINGDASEDADGYRGFDTTHSQTLTVTLEDSPSSALSVTYSVHDSSDETSPLASKNAPSIAWNENGQKSITPSDVNDSVSIDMPSSGIHSYIIRATAVVPHGSAVFERIVSINTPTIPPLRKWVPTETQQYTPRYPADEQNDIVDFLYLTGGISGIEGPTGPTGAQGQTGPTGPTGIQLFGLTNNTILRANGTDDIQDSGIAIDDSDRITEVKTLNYDEIYSNGSKSSNFTIYLNNGQVQTVTLNNSGSGFTITFDPSDITGPGEWTLIIFQNGTGNNYIAVGVISGGTVYKPSDVSTIPPAGAGANEVHIAKILYTGPTVPPEIYFYLVNDADFTELTD